jgi:DNA-binding transcriptional regulator YdaS (Cro superfamily)
MSLREYLFHNDVKMKDMAQALGIHYAYMRQLKSGIKRPGFELSTKIELLTGGQVTLKELRG